jgi:hypothetical protein
VVPLLTPMEFTLGTVQSTNDAGQVTAVGEEKVQLPLPSAVRILGLKSGETSDSSEDGSEEQVYQFEGYRIEVNDKVALTPVGTPEAVAHG